MYICNNCGTIQQSAIINAFIAAGFSRKHIVCCECGQKDVSILGDVENTTSYEIKQENIG